MPFVCPNLVFETTTVTGTGAATLLGATGDFLDFDSQLANGDTVPYTIEHAAEKEVGIGTFSTSGPTLTRTTILFSTNGGAAVDFGAGTKNVYSGLPGEFVSSLLENGLSDGFLAQIADNTFARRELTSSSGNTITNPAGVAADPVINATFLSTQTGAVERNTLSRLDEIVSIKDFSLTVGSPAVDATVAFQAAADAGGLIFIPPGQYLITDTVTFTKPVQLIGAGRSSEVYVDSSLGASTDVFELNPDLAEDKYQWTFRDFSVIPESGTPGRHCFHIDITTTNKFLANLEINILSEKLGGDFIFLTNPTNVDGLFISKFNDNWCQGGFNLHECGDSLFFERNTISGASIGPAFDVDPLSDSAIIVLRGNNCTASGGLCHIRRGRGIVIDQNNVEVTETFDGFNNGAISIDDDHSQFAWNTKVTNNSINTHGNVTSCVHVERASNTYIDGNTLFCDPATDAHITIASTAYNTIIGNGNIYQSSVSGAVITPVITDNGLGTMGLLTAYSLTLSGWALIDAVNDHPLEYIKSRSGIVTLFGSIDGPSAGVAATLFTIPLGYRPKRINRFTVHDTSGDPFRLMVLPTGEIQVTDGGCTSLYLDGISWFSAQVTV